MIFKSHNLKDLRNNLKKNLTPGDILTIIYISIIGILIFIYREKINYWYIFLGLHIIAILFIIIISELKEVLNIGLIRVIKDWYPVPFIMLLFKEQPYLIPNINPKDLDLFYIKIDYWIFGLDPPFWFIRYYNPFITEFLQIVYTSFYFLPIIFGLMLYLKKKRKEFIITQFAIVLGFYTSFLGYYAFPALGPRFIFEELKGNPPEGILITKFLQDTLNRLESINRDAFPSGHAEVTLIILYLSYKFEKGFFIILLPLTISLLISTVYLQYHYVVDILAGAFLTVVCIYIVFVIYRKRVSQY